MLAIAAASAAPARRAFARQLANSNTTNASSHWAQVARWRATFAPRNKPPEDPDDIAVDARQKQQGRKSAPTVRLKLNEADIRESFVKGSGPGGQKINKVRSCVQLTHLPTGIQVQCQDARDLISNRAIARKMLAEKVEFHLRGKDSRIGRRVSRVQKQKAKSRSRSRKAQQLRDGVGEESHDEEEEEKEQEQEHEVTHAHPAEGKPG